MVELGLGNGEWQSLMAELIPAELDDAIKGHRAAFFMAQKDLTPQSSLISCQWPLQHHQLAEFPGVTKYPVDGWEEAGSPMLTTKGGSSCVCA